MLNKIKQINLPHKYNIFGINVSATNYDELLGIALRAGKMRQSLIISHLAVHGLIIGSKDPSFMNILNNFDIVAPDGMPLKVALNRIYKTQLQDRVYGPEFMLRICERVAANNIKVYLYGSKSHVVKSLRDNLLSKFNRLKIVGCEPSVFRPLTRAEDEFFIKRVKASGAGIVFLGLGCPIQERFAFEHRNKIKAVQICVGAAFDFHAGNTKMAPKWMQKNSLEWFFRLSQEPTRLWRRYLITNTLFIYKILSNKIKE